MSDTTDNRRGALLLVAAAAVFTADVSVLRLLSEGVSNGQVVFFRSLMQLVIVAGFILWRNPALAGTTQPWLLVARGITSLICWWLYYASFAVLDLALASTLTFTTSLFVVILAPFVLGERIGPVRAASTVIGFAGVVLASGANPFDIAPGVWLGLGSAVAAAVLIFQNRVLARTQATATIMLWIALVATLGTAPGAVMNWTALTGGDVAVLLIAGTLGTLGMLLTIEAYRYGEVSALAPFPYTRILFALLAGVLLFGESATPAELAGSAIIIACGLIAGRRMRRAPTAL
ncbi:DMT family transporter [Oceanibium sediminis]|uniref:DMT family transporter n=1 Tax=Oceanibium sediminis TaxID=2026339 RepID=UPI000DD3B7C9|nr:DMT family transporter [Oceanibium sediminis]